MHSEGVRVCAAIFVPASARAPVACSGSCRRRHTTAVVTGKSVTCTSGITASGTITG
jgi:hypothetical protein